jgi:hypothetical protein
MQKKLMFAALCLTLALAIVYVKPASPQTPLETILIRPDGTVYLTTAANQTLRLSGREALKTPMARSITR